MTHVTCRLTAKNRDQLRNPTLGRVVTEYEGQWPVWILSGSLMSDIFV